MRMRTFLDTVLEVPIPEEMVANSSKNNSNYWLQSIKSCMTPSASVSGSRAAEIQFLLGVIGAPLIPLPIRCDPTVNIIDGRHGPIESSKAKYIVKQYIGAVGGEKALNSIDSMCAMGKVKMAASEVGPGEIGRFVVWQKRPDLWSLELMVGGVGYKISAGSDGKVAWKHTPWHGASQGPPSLLRRSLQGLDPRSTANLFSNSIYVGEKMINDEDCFVLKLEAEAAMLKARSSSNVEIMSYTIWGCFSQRSGLLIQLEDSSSLRKKAPGAGPGNDVFWQTTMESLIQDYRRVEEKGVNIAHSGRTCVSLFQFGQNSEKKTMMEEIWNVEELDFNIRGLSIDCFLLAS